MPEIEEKRMPPARLGAAGAGGAATGAGGAGVGGGGAGAATGAGCSDLINDLMERLTLIWEDERDAASQAEVVEHG